VQEIRFAFWSKEIEKGDPSFLKFLLRNKFIPINQSYPDGCGQTLLDRAIERNHLQVVEVLLEHGAEKATGQAELTLLNLTGREEIAKLLQRPNFNKRAREEAELALSNKRRRLECLRVKPSEQQMEGEILEALKAIYALDPTLKTKLAEEFRAPRDGLDMLSLQLICRARNLQPPSPKREDLLNTVLEYLQQFLECMRREKKKENLLKSAKGKTGMYYI